MVHRFERDLRGLAAVEEAQGAHGFEDPKPYQALLEAVNARGEQQIKLIQKFLSGYYAGMRKTYWYDSHLGENAGFFGYWCFELAAFVKALNIEDSAFSDNIFYPIDLVKEARIEGSVQS